jgi:hypothetical protein
MPSASPGGKGAGGTSFQQAMVDQRPVFSRKYKIYRPRKSRKKTKWI